MDKVTIKDIRATKLCASGARDFFKRHNIDWDDFLKNGTSIEVIKATNDAMAAKVITAAYKRIELEKMEASNGRGQ